MFEVWITTSNLPAEGRDFTFADQAIWLDRIKEFGLPVQMGDKSLEAQVNLLPQGENGVLARGTLSGAVTLPCDRCAKDFEFAVDTSFDLYEELPEDVRDDELDETRMRKRDDGNHELDVASLLWEELMLALPSKPLCNDSCKGICPGCGKDLNTGECSCEQDDGDPRLAVFRDLKIK